MGTGSQPSLWEELTKLSVPTLAVVGEEDEKFAALARDIEAVSQPSCAATVKEAGHVAHSEVTETYISLLRNLLEK